jgi:hypothetical protein
VLYHGDRVLTFSADGGLIYLATDCNTPHMIIECVSADSFEDLGPAITTPDGAHIGYAAKQDGRWTVVVDGISSGTFDGLGEGTPVFSHDGKRVAVDGKVDDKWRVVVDGTVLPDAYDVTLRGTPCLRLVIGTSCPVFERISPTWS